MKLYSGPLSLFTAKVRIALDEKALAYERVEVGWSLANRYEPHHPDVVALNPKRQVPVLVDGDVVVYDSTLIFEYLEERQPQPALAPRDPAGRARCRQLEAFAEAQRKLKTESGMVRLSVDNPANPVDPTKRTGELVSKDVTITANVRTPDGASADRTLVVTMQRAVLQGEPAVEGKWIVTSVRDATSPAGSKTS